jgi:hypothetical protein
MNTTALMPLCPVQTTAEVAPEEAIRQLQTMMPPPPRSPPEPVLLENVSPGLLLPPAGRGLVGISSQPCSVLFQWPGWQSPCSHFGHWIHVVQMACHHATMQMALGSVCVHQGKRGLLICCLCVGGAHLLALYFQHTSN